MNQSYNISQIARLYARIGSALCKNRLVGGGDTFTFAMLWSSLDTFPERQVFGVLDTTEADSMYYCRNRASQWRR